MITYMDFILELCKKDHHTHIFNPLLFFCKMTNWKNTNLFAFVNKLSAKTEKKKKAFVS